MAYLRTSIGARALSKQGSSKARSYGVKPRVLRRRDSNQAPLLSSSSQSFTAESMSVAGLPRTTSGSPSGFISVARITSSTSSSQSSSTSISQSSTVVTPDFASTPSMSLPIQIAQGNPLSPSYIPVQRTTPTSYPLFITSDTPVPQSLPTDIVNSVVSIAASSTKGALLDSLTAHLRAASSTRTDGSTSTSSPGEAGVISRNPPIIAGIILMGVVFIAAIGSLVSWIVRARRRQRNHHLASLGLENEPLENAFDNLQESDASREKLCGRHDAFKYPDRPSPPILSPRDAQGESFMADNPVNQSTRGQEGPYFTVFQTTGRGTPSPRAVPIVPRHRENFGVQRADLPRFMALQGQGLGHPWMPPSHAPFTEEPFPVLPIPRTESPANALPSRRSSKDHLAWTTSLRTTLSSALEAARQAAGHRTPETITPLSSAGPSSRRSTILMRDDAFTPMVLRPARMSMSKGGGLARRDTAEGRELAFKASRPKSSISSSARKSDAFASASAELSRRPSTLTCAPSRLERNTSKRKSIPHDRATAYSSGLQAHPSTLSSRSRSRSVSGSSVTRVV